MEDFLAKESNEITTDEFNDKTSSSNIDTKNDDFFIPEEEVNPKKRVGEKVDPFKEADLLNASQKESDINRR